MCNLGAFGVFDYWGRAVLSQFMFFQAAILHVLCPHLLQLFRRMLQCCFVAKLWKCFANYKTSPDLSSASVIMVSYFFLNQKNPPKTEKT